MKNNKTPQTALFCDCDTDAERAEFFACGRAVETGVVAPAIAPQIADVYERATELLEALTRIMDNERPIRGNPSHKVLVEHWEFEKSQGRGCADDMLFALAAIAKATGATQA